MFSHFLLVDMAVGKIGNLSNKITSKPPELAHETREKTQNIFWGDYPFALFRVFRGQNFYCRVGNHLRNLGYKLIHLDSNFFNTMPQSCCRIGALV